MTDDTIKLALKYFSKDYNCSQSVMKSILESKGMDFDEIFQLSSGFGGGYGLQGHICGAVSGAVAALGVLNSRKYTDYVKHNEATYVSVKKLIQRFTEKNETIVCNELTGFNISDQAALEKAVEDGTFEKVCPGILKDAIGIVHDLTEA